MQLISIEYHIYYYREKSDLTVRQLADGGKWYASLPILYNVPMCRIIDCKRKDVINVCDGKRIGYVADIIFDPKTGCIEAIIVPGPCGICGFLGHEKEYIIPWKCICQFGEDVVLVEVRLKDVEKPCKL